MEVAKLSEDEISSYTAAFNKIDADGGGVNSRAIWPATTLCDIWAFFLRDGLW